MNTHIENTQNTLNDGMNICDVDITQGLSILESRSEKSIEEKEDSYKYSQFCENIFTVNEEHRDDNDYVKKIEKNNKDCINIFDQCLINS